MMEQAIRVSILHEPGGRCSACRTGVSRSVRVKADRPTARHEFLFCRACARRIGVAGERLVNRTNRNGV